MILFHIDCFIVLLKDKKESRNSIILILDDDLILDLFQIKEKIWNPAILFLQAALFYIDAS